MTRTFVIAEVGPNHNGSLKLALDMIEKLASVGVDAIKFQLVVPESLYSKDSFKAPYQEKSHNISALEMCKLNQLSRSEHLILFEECKKFNVEYLCTAFDIESLRFLNEELNISRFKIASGEILSLDLLDYMRNSDKPILLSTGMATIDEISNTIDYINKNSEKDITILHCISSYPASLENVNMNVMITLKEKFGYPVGFSDHTIGTISSTTAVAMGASVIEKHVTMDKNLTGPDHQASSTIEEFADLTKLIRVVEKIKGNSFKSFSENELGVSKAARKSLVSSKTLENGHVILDEDLCYKRPGTGISPIDKYLVLGKKVKITIKKDSLMFLENLHGD